jgi:hypothetical protein
MRREFPCQDLVTNLLVKLPVERRGVIGVQDKHGFISNKGKLFRTAGGGKKPICTHVFF